MKKWVWKAKNFVLKSVQFLTRVCALTFFLRIRAVFLALRNWCTRNEDLKLTAALLSHIFQQQGGDMILEQFLKKGELRYSQINTFYDKNIKPKPFFDNPFRKTIPPSRYWINNHIAQIRNILISKIFQNRKDTNSQQFLEGKLKHLGKIPLNSLNTFFEEVIHGFEQKKKEQLTPIPPYDLHDYMLTRFFAKISKETTRYAQIKLCAKKGRAYSFARRYVK